MTNEQPSRFSNFVAELKRRHVGRVAIAYAAVAFVLLQAGEIILPVFDVPMAVQRLIVVLVLLGFPIAIALAWIYEISPRGIRRTPDLEPMGPGRPGPARILPRVGLLGLILLSAGVAGWWMMTWEPQAASDGLVTSQADLGGTSTAWPVSYDPSAPIRSLAVLPFEDFSSDPQPHFAAGMHDALILELSQIEALRVVSRTSVMRYAGTIKTSPEIGRELGVQAIIEGSVTKAGERVRITVQLIDVRTDEHIWSESYEGDLSDIIALQGRVAAEIAGEVELELTPEEEVQLAEAPTLNPEAADAYWRGRYEQSKGTPEGYEAAIRHFEEAVHKDSSFAPAYTGLAGAHLLAGSDDSIQVIELLPQALEAAEKAIVLSGNSPEAQAVMAEIKTRVAESGALEVQYNLKLDSLEKQLRPRRFEVETPVVVNEEWLARMTDFGNELRRLSVRREATDLTGLPAEHQIRVARQLESLGEYDRAEEVLRGCVDHDPSSQEAWEALERLHAIRGEYGKCVEVRKERLARSGEKSEAVAAASALEKAVAERGAQGYWAQRRAELAAKELRGEPVSQADYAMVVLALGERDAALDRLEAAYEAREPGMVSLFNDPIWDPLRGDPRFRALLRQIRSTRWPQPVPPPPGG